MFNKVIVLLTLALSICASAKREQDIEPCATHVDGFLEIIPNKKSL